MAAPGLNYDGLEASWTVSGIVADICERAGIPSDLVSTGELAMFCDGYHFSADIKADEALEELAKTFFFDFSGRDGGVAFVARGGDSVAAIDSSQDFLESTKQKRQKIGDTIKVPRVLHVLYYDVESGLNTDKQTSDRSIDTRARDEKRIETNVVMRANDAKAMAIVSHKVLIEEQIGDIEFSLPDSFLYLTVSDVITVDGQRLRIDECNVDDGFQDYRCKVDRQSAYGTTIEGVPVQSPSEPPTLIIGDTVFHFMDIPILKDYDDRLGYYVAVAGDGAWNGATVEMSIDGGNTYIEALSDSAWANMGVLESVLPAHNVDYPDVINTLRVRMVRDDMEFESTNLEGVLNRFNLALVGDELINFVDCDEVEPGLWDFTYLLRGRKDTGAVQHEIGERFILLEREYIYFIDAERFMLSKDYTFRVTSNGGTNADEYTESFTGQSQVEFAPWDLTAVRDGGNIVITWDGRPRLGGAGVYNNSQYFDGYLIDVNGTDYTTDDETITVTDPGGSVTISVCGVNAITGSGHTVETTI